MIIRILRLLYPLFIILHLKEQYKNDTFLFDINIWGTENHVLQV